MPIPDGDPVFSARVDIELRDGTTIGHYQAGFRGHPSRPASAAEIEEKFIGNVAGTLGEDAAAEIITVVTRLHHTDSVRPLTALLRRP
jgi:2-methylcitrate dehydratase PrpD